MKKICSDPQQIRKGGGGDLPFEVHILARLFGVHCQAGRRASLGESREDKSLGISWVFADLTSPNWSPEVGSKIGAALRGFVLYTLIKRIFKPVLEVGGTTGSFGFWLGHWKSNLGPALTACPLSLCRGRPGTASM